MTDNETFYRWTKFKNGVGSVAMVTLDVSKNNSDQNKIELFFQDCTIFEKNLYYYTIFHVFLVTLHPN